MGRLFDMSHRLLGGVEAGGTKMVCAVAYEPDQILDLERFPTTNAEETLTKVKGYFERIGEKYGIPNAIGYGSFGPAGVNPSSPDYGKILNTPKLGWQGADVLSFFAKAFPDTRFSFDTDVNAAALGEGFAGVARGVKNFIYVTVGTGIGGGVIIDGKPLQSRPHAEIGHMLVPIAAGELADYEGSCPFHGRCLEGLASGTALGARWGMPAYELAPDHEAWQLETRYLAEMVMNLVACYGPDKIILGGGVMEQDFLLDMVRAELAELMGGYWQEHVDLLVRPQLENEAGITGALLMASSA